MANNRSAIRSALKTLLVNASTAAGSNVFSNRSEAYWQSELPAIVIFSETEPVVPESQRQTRYIRTLNLRVECRVEASDSVDDEVDSLLAEIESAIQLDKSLGGTVLGTKQINTEIRFDSEGEKPIAVGVLSFESTYVS